MSKPKEKTKPGFEITPAVVALADVCPTDGAREALQHIHIRTNRTAEATDGHVLAQVTPYLPKNPQLPLPKPMVIPAVGLTANKHLLKRTPAVIKPLGDSLQIITPDSKLVVKAGTTPECYPNIDQVMPHEKAEVRVCLSATLLIRLLKMIIKMVKVPRRETNYPVVFTFRKGQADGKHCITAISWEAGEKTPDGETVSGVIMPSRVPEEK
ncbi:MAG TPA: hypothetical protein VFI02_14115 [Armatimonadota bacterium]|nr:hypothetical protein [Armatimonadota bacterium]